MSNAFSRIKYGSFLSYILLPQKTKYGFSLKLDNYLLSNKSNSNQIIDFLPSFHSIASRDNTSFNAVHNLSWLSDLSNDLNEEELGSLTLYLSQTMFHYCKYSKDFWEIGLLSQRLFFGLYGSGFILSKINSSELHDQYSLFLLHHAIFLRNSLRKLKRRDDYILFLIRSALASICIGDERKYLTDRLEQIYKNIDHIFTSECGHITRNSSLHFRILIELICLRDALVNAGVSVSVKIQKIIAKSCDYLSFMRHNDGGFALFNGSKQENPIEINKVFNQSPGSVSTMQTTLRESEYYILSQNKSFIIADFKTKPNVGGFVGKYQGSLSFEYSVGNSRVIVNKGTIADNISNPRQDDMISSDAHSSISLDGYELQTTSKNPNISGKKNIKVICAVTHQGTVLEGARNVRCIKSKSKSLFFSHYRKILLHKGGGVVQGEDWICAGKDFHKLLLEKVPVILCRFHLHPDISAVISRTGSIVIDIPGEGQRVFNTGSGNLSIDESIYYGNSHPQNTKQIIIKAPFKKDIIKIRWAMQSFSTNSSTLKNIDLTRSTL